MLEETITRLQEKDDYHLDTLYFEVRNLAVKHKLRIKAEATSLHLFDGTPLQVTWEYEYAGLFNQQAVRILNVEETPFYVEHAPNQDHGALRLLYWHNDAEEKGWKTWKLTQLSFEYLEQGERV